MSGADPGSAATTVPTLRSARSSQGTSTSAERSRSLFSVRTSAGLREMVGDCRPGRRPRLLRRRAASRPAHSAAAVRAVMPSNAPTLTSSSVVVPESGLAAWVTSGDVVTGRGGVAGAAGATAAGTSVGSGVAGDSAVGVGATEEAGAVGDDELSGAGAGVSAGVGAGTAGATDAGASGVFAGLGADEGVSAAPPAVVDSGGLLAGPGMRIVEPARMSSGFDKWFTAANAGNCAASPNSRSAIPLNVSPAATGTSRSPAVVGAGGCPGMRIVEPARMSSGFDK